MTKTITGILLDEQECLTLEEICTACSTRTEWIVELVEEGVLQPLEPESGQWRFTARSLSRAHVATRLRRDLDINLAGVALALDLLDEIEELRRQSRLYLQQDDQGRS
jgi:chaperone modulatory protein CbpM